ncbi:MAG: hypothetical protein HQL08_03230 [Nitrospirae bacterium]|nr:hypothetical protein [Nitrospirota bacterium]
MLQKMQKKLLIFLQLLITLSIVAPSFSYAGDILIKPGKFDHFNISLPEGIVAGQEATVSLQAVDAFNNVLFNFGDTEREFQIWVTGSAAVKPPSFKSSSFSNGSLVITLSDRVAETFTLSVRESGSPIPIMTKDLTVSPNRLTSFEIKAPRIAQAGEAFELRIVAKDAFNNTVTEPISGKNINLIFKGDADPKIVMSSIPDFKNGSVVIALVSQKSGSAQVDAKDLITGSVGSSDKIEINSGAVNSFKLFAPKDVIAGEPFEVSIVAVDRFNNVVINYSAVGSGVSITSTGRLKPFPPSIPAYEFVSGQAKVDLRYDIAEDIAIVATENIKGQKGATETIRVTSPVPERYEVTTPESALAGQKFKLKVTVFNQLNHVIKNYNLVGPDVLLTSSGSGTLVPNKIPASEFVDGNAIVEVQYNKSEAFSIVASSAKTSTPSSPVQPLQMPVEIKKPAASAEKQAVKPTAPVKQLKKSKKAKAKEAKEAKEAEKEKKKEAKAKGKHQLEINNISLVESKKKSVIAVNIPGIDNALKYNATLETIDGKKWVVLKIQPATSKVEKSYKFTSTFVGDIQVDEDTQDKGTVTLKIELLKPSKFHITKEKNSIAINLHP